MEIAADHSKNVKIEFTPDVTKIRCFGSFFKSDWMTRQELENMEEELNKKTLENLFESELPKITTLFFLDLQRFLIVKFDEHLTSQRDANQLQKLP